MFFRIVIACIALLAAYAGWQLFSAKNYYTELSKPLAPFTVFEREGNRSPLTIVEFMHYDCGYCKDSHRVLVDYALKTEEIRLVTRPVPYEGGGAELAAKRVMAAGLQGKFREMDSALAEYKGKMDEKFYRESAALYDIDYEKMVADADSKDVFEMLKDNAAATQRAGVESTPAFLVGKTLYQLDAPLTLPDLIRMVRAEQAR